MPPIINVALHHNGIPRQNSGDVPPPKTPMLAGNPPKMTTAPSSDIDDTFSLPLVARNWRSQASTLKLVFNPMSTIVSAFRSFFPALQSLLIPSCHWIPVAPNKSKSVAAPRAGHKKRPLTGTFFGQKKCRVSFAVQETPRSEPVLLLELATNTSHLVKEMASGTVRILLECEKTGGNGAAKTALWDEPVWTMYCNGHKLGYAVSRERTESDLHVLSTVQSVSVGAGVMPPALMLPAPKEKRRDCAQPTAGREIMYMRARFDRVIGGKDSEAFYMINPDCNSGGAGKFNGGGPELSIFLLRI